MVTTASNWHGVKGDGQLLFLLLLFVVAEFQPEEQVMAVRPQAGTSPRSLTQIIPTLIPGWIPSNQKSRLDSLSDDWHSSAVSTKSACFNIILQMYKVTILFCMYRPLAILTSFVGK